MIQLVWSHTGFAHLWIIPIINVHKISLLLSQTIKACHLLKAILFLSITALQFYIIFAKS